MPRPAAHLLAPAPLRKRAFSRPAPGLRAGLGLAGLALAGLALCLAGPGQAVAEGAAGGFCGDPMAQCGGLIQETCLERFGAASVSVAESGECRSQIDRYRSCVSRIAEECGPATLTGAGQPAQGGRAGAGADSDTKLYCQTQTDSCLTAVNDDYRDCRETGGSGCRADCRDERDLARESCNDGLRTCLATGGFRAAAFVYPSCASPGATERRAGDPAPTKSGGDALPTPVGGAGAICRNGVYYCFMFQPGPVGAPCGCSGNPAMGVPPFQGFVSPQ
jgi:hypothetical protein